MYYLDENMSLEQAQETKVFRVFGGEVELEGGYVTDTPPDNPIQARADLALSQHYFDARNLACEVVEGTIYTDDAGQILTLDGEYTGHALEFTEVEPTPDQPGGGQEYHLEDNWSTVVQVDTVRELNHHSTVGWEHYTQAEQSIMELDNNSSMTYWEDIQQEEPVCIEALSVDDVLDDEIYALQKEDAEGAFVEMVGVESDGGREARWPGDEDLPEVDTAEESLNQLIDDELYDLQTSDDGWRQGTCLEDEAYYEKPVNAL